MLGSRDAEENELRELVEHAKSVSSVAEILAIPESCEAVLVLRLDDAKVEALALRPSVRGIVQDGSSTITDNGVA